MHTYLRRCYATLGVTGFETSLLLTAYTAAFFNIFAATEPSENVCVVHGTLCNDPSVYIATTA